MEDIKELVEQIEHNRTISDQRHVDTTDALKQINLTLIEQGRMLNELKPMNNVAKSIEGFGTVMAFAFKWIIVPISVIVGIIISIKRAKE